MLARESDGHSRNVRRRRFDVTMVNGPFGTLNVCFVYRRIKDFIRVVFPTYTNTGNCQTTYLLTEAHRLARKEWSTYSWRTNDSNDQRRSLFGNAINERYMQSLFFHLKDNSIDQLRRSSGICQIPRSAKTYIVGTSCLPFSFPGI